jgi:hypothetical protein
MITTGTFQVMQKRHDIMNYTPEFRGILGTIPRNVTITIYGDSGHGKTEFAMRMVRALCLSGVYVDWISYEQGFGLDMQQLLQRNDMLSVGSYFSITDPDHKKNPDTTYLADLDNKIGKRGSADVFAIDSVQYMSITIADWLWLKKRHPKKGFIFISHKKGTLPDGVTAVKIGRDSLVRLLVKNYIAYPEKNRCGGKENYIIWEERARLLEPKLFEKWDKAKVKTLFTPLENTDNEHEGEGVIAENED